jgi:anti-sigma factor RsiW
MNRTHALPLTDDEIHVLVDGRVNAPDRTALEARLAQDPAAQATVARWQQQREQLRGLYPRMLDEPVAASLLTAAQELDASRQTARQWTRWSGMAASVVLSFGVGWLLHGQWQLHQPAALLAKAPVVTDFVRQAGLAYAVYTPEVRHPVEVTANEQAHLVQWLSKRLGKPLKVPDLTEHGYDLVGGRLLPGESGARAQFMFQNAAGNRITLYLGTVNAAPPGSGAPQETAFRFSADGAAPSFYWVDQGFGYALSGQVSKETLLQLAQATYRQL